MLEKEVQPFFKGLNTLDKIKSPKGMDDVEKIEAMCKKLLSLLDSDTMTHEESASFGLIMEDGFAAARDLYEELKSAWTYDDKDAQYAYEASLDIDDDSDFSSRAMERYKRLNKLATLTESTQGNSDIYNLTRERVLQERGGKDDSSLLYGVGLPEHKDVELSMRKVPRSLSTRYSPDRPGVMVSRLADGIVQDPYTNKVYNWLEGFKTESGDEFPGGSVSLQTELNHR